MSNAKKVAPKLESNVSKKLASIETVSGKMRYLASIEYSRADIARILDKRYQHVKNVLDRPLKSS